MKTSLNPVLRRALCGSVFVFIILGMSATYSQTNYPLPAMDPGKTKESEPKLGFSDRRFVSKAAKAGRDEVEISRIAVQRATRPEVRDFAQMVVTAHEQVNFTLTQIATAKEVKLPEASKVENWLKKKSADFDKDYIREMVDAQDNSVALFAGASRKCADQDVVAFAIKYLPTLQEHLVKAKELNKAFP